MSDMNLDDLARMMKDQFDELQIVLKNQFSVVNENLGEIKVNLEYLKERLERLENRTKEDSDVMAGEIIELKKKKMFKEKIK